jgi:hypothetical protein
MDALTSARSACACLTTFVSASATVKYALASISAGNRSAGTSTRTGMSSRVTTESIDGYFKEVAPALLVSPADGPYNMTYVIGDYSKISWKQQAQIDHDSGMINRRLPVQDTGGAYQPPE